MTLVRLLTHIATQPLAMQPEVIGQLRGVLHRRLEQGRLTSDEVQAAIGDNRREQTQSGSGTVVLPVHGAIGHRAALVQDVSSGVGTSTEVLANQIRAARRDPDVANIVLDIESPGGGVWGLTEVARELRGAREDKRVIAHANSYAASAAYWIASQAGEVWVDPDGEVGSVGVWTMHQDISGRLEGMGVDVTLISAGDYKVEANPFEPLSDEARDELQSKVDEAYDRFVSAVSEGRGVSKDQVLSDFGKGRMVIDRNAVAAGMADRIGTMADLLGDLGVQSRGRQRNRESRRLQLKSVS